MLLEKLDQIEKDIKEAMKMMEDLLDYGSTRAGPESCKHLNSELRPSDNIGHATCHDCGSDVMIFTVFNNWIEEFKKIRETPTFKIHGTRTGRFNPE